MADTRYKLNESAGAVAVDSEGDANGTLIGFTLPADWQSARFGDGLLFSSGVSQQIEIPEGNFQDTDDWSVSFWVRFDSTTDTPRLFSSNGPGLNQIVLEATPGVSPSLFVRYLGSSVSWPLNDLRDGREHHICVTFVNATNTVSCWYDGNKQVDAIMPGATGQQLTFDGPFFVGNYTDGPTAVRSFVGLMDEFRFASRIFSDNEVQSFLTTPLADYDDIAAILTRLDAIQGDNATISGTTGVEDATTSGTIVYSLVVRDGAGTLIAADSAPTWAITLVSDGNPVAGNLVATANPSAGNYTAEYSYTTTVPVRPDGWHVRATWLQGGNAKQRDIYTSFSSSLVGVTAAENAQAVRTELAPEMLLVSQIDTTLDDIAPSGDRRAAGEGVLVTNLDGVSGGGTTQPRVNKPAGRAFRLEVSSRRDGTHKATLPVTIRPGTINPLAVSIDMSPLFDVHRVVNVGTPIVSPLGTLTAIAVGPRDTEAMIQLGGTAYSSSTYTINIPVTMDSDGPIDVDIDVVVFDD